RQLNGHEKTKDAVYQGWLADGGADAFAAASSAAAELLAAIEQKFPNGKCLDKLRNLAGWISEVGGTLQAAAAEADRAKAAASASAEATPVAPSGHGEAPGLPMSMAMAPMMSAMMPGNGQAMTAPGTPTNGGVLVEGAPALGLLM